MSRCSQESSHTQVPGRQARAMIGDPDCTVLVPEPILIHTTLPTNAKPIFGDKTCRQPSAINESDWVEQRHVALYGNCARSAPLPRHPAEQAIRVHAERIDRTTLARPRCTRTSRGRPARTAGGECRRPVNVRGSRRPVRTRPGRFRKGKADDDLYYAGDRRRLPPAIRLRSLWPTAASPAARAPPAKAGSRSVTLAAYSAGFGGICRSPQTRRIRAWTRSIRWRRYKASRQRTTSSGSHGRLTRPRLAVYLAPSRRACRAAMVHSQASSAERNGRTGMASRPADATRSG